MARGGKRTDAGRKPKLTEGQRLNVGRECAGVWQELHDDAVRAAIEEHLGPDMVRTFKRLRDARESGIPARDLRRLLVVAAREVSSLRELPRHERGVIRVFHQLNGMRAHVQAIAEKHNVSVREAYKCWRDYRAIVEWAETAA